VLSYIVALRRREIGVRLAVGAPPSRIVTLVVRQALKLVLAGMVCGLALAVPMAFAMRATFVAKVTATDPMVFLPTISVLLAVGILAAVVPALRASRIDPIATLRQE
jgi:putative ABC transport system permease protein